MSITAVSQNVEIPSWLNTAFLEDILEKHTKGSVVVIGAEVEEVVPKGNNYLSVLHRITVRFRLQEAAEECSLIVKSLPKGDAMQKMVREMKCFAKESHMYRVTLPALHQLVTPRLLGPRCYFSTGQDILVLEDLTRLGYRMGDRRKGLDLEHCRAVMQELAHFHASSLALFRVNPDSMDMYSESMFDELGRKRTEELLQSQLNELAVMVENWPGYERFGEKIRAHIPTLLEKVMDVVKPQEGRLSVLNHGDCWVNNIMFRNCPTSGKILDCRFVDFQITRFSSPALDLQYFFTLSPSLEVRTHHIQQLLREYHSRFLDALHQLKIHYIDYPLQQFLKDFEGKNLFGLYIALFFLKVIIAEVEDIPDVSTLKEEDLTSAKTSVWSGMAKGERFKELLQALLPAFEQKGVL